MVTFIKILIGTVVLSFFLAYSIFSYAVVNMHFWDWFIIPVFPSISSLSFWQAVGLGLIIALVKGYRTNVMSHIRPEYLKRDSLNQTTIIFLLFPWFLFLLGFILK